ncbi:MAG: DUF6531 domain-containing protein [Desulfobacterales bacterium]|nr:DUF6531 domain-containing protein [Desulfobacterales bacterium]
MNISKQLHKLPLTLIMLAIFALLTATSFADDEPTSDHLKKTMDCDWAITNPDETNPDNYINDGNDDLVKLAESLGNDPVKIYNWVYKNIYFPQFLYDKGGHRCYYYEDSRLGAMGAYLNKIGNHWDQSSLLIALLRISKIPARYVKIHNGNIVYVEAWMDLDNYCSILGGSQKGWVPLVPWLKEIDLVEGFDLFKDVADFESDPPPPGLDFDFTGYLSSIKYQSVLELYENKIQEYLNVNYHGKSLKDIPFKEVLIDKTTSLLPRSLPKKLISGDRTRYFEVPEENRDNIHLYIKKTDGTSLLDYILFMPQIAGKKFCLDWTYSGTQLTPVFKIDSRITCTGSQSITAEESITLSYKIKDHSQTVNRPERVAGTYIHMGFDPLSASIKTIEKAKQNLQTIDAGLVLDPTTHEEYFGLMGQVLVETFLNRLYENSKKAAGYFYGTQCWGLCPVFIYSKPHSEENPVLTDAESKFYYHPQWNIDAQVKGNLKRLDSVDNAIISPPGDAPINQTCSRLIGYGASYDEGRIFEDWMDTPGASTIKGLMVANEDLDGTGNRSIELVESDIDETPTALTCNFNDLTQIEKVENKLFWIDPYKAFDGFHIDGLRVADGFKADGYSYDTNAVAGDYAILVTGTTTIERGTKFDLNSVDVSALFNDTAGVTIKFQGYKGSSRTPAFTVYKYAKTKSRATKNFNNTNAITDINKLVITLVTTNKGPVILDNMAYTRKEYIADIENETELHLGYESVLSLIDQLRDGSRVITPIQQVRYAELSGDIRIVHSPVSDLYSFGMDNGGSASTFTLDDYSSTYLDAYNFDTYIYGTPAYTSILDDYSTTVNNIETATYITLPNTANALEHYAGDPVDMVKGEFYTEEEPDFKIKSRGFDLSVYRKYKSRLIYNGPFGFGWTWNHAERIIPLESDDVIYHNNDGVSFEITYEDDVCVYPKGSRFVLEKLVDGYSITQNQSRIKSFFSIDGYLVKKEDPFGNTLEYEYTHPEFANRITKIKDALGRSLTLDYNANGKVEKITDFTGRYCTYGYGPENDPDNPDRKDNLIAFTDLESNLTQYEYLYGQENEFNNHNMRKYILPNGDWLEIGYYRNDQAAYHTNKKGETFNFMYSRLNRYAETWNEEGYYRKIFFNESSDVVRYANEDGTIEQMEYDDHHNKISHTDGNGNTTVFQYYPDGTPESEQDGFAAKRKLYVKTNAMGQSRHYKYESVNHPFAPSEIIDPNGNITRFAYNLDSSLNQKIQAPGYEYNEEGVLVNNGSDGLITVYTYDDYGNVLTITSPDESFIVNTYDENDLYLESVQDKNGMVTEYNYYKTCGADRADWKPISSMKSKEVVLPDETTLKTSYEYNLYGQVAKEINPLLQTTEFNYDVNRKLTKKIEANGAETIFEYDTARDVVSGAKLIQMTDPEGHIETYQYDKTGNLIEKTDKNGNITIYAYDQMNRPICEIDPLYQSKWLTYDGAGNVVEKVDPNGNVTTFQYDAANRLVKMITPEGEENGFYSTIAYDSNGNKIIETDAEGIKTQYIYNELNQITSKTIGYLSSQPRTFEYRYNAAGQIIKETQSPGNFTAYEYDGNGNLIDQKTYDKDGITLLRHTIIEYYDDARNLIKSKTIKDGFETDGTSRDIIEQYEYDALGRKMSVTDSNGYKTKYEYDSVGNLVLVIDPSGALTQYGYDKNKRLISTTNAIGDTTITGYDAVGNVTMTRDALGNETLSFYDAANRKISVEDALGNINIIDYDANGNVIAQTDPKGNVTRLEYDMDNRLVRETDALGNETKMTYDHTGRIILKESAKHVFTQMLYDDPSGQVTKTTQAMGTMDESITQFQYDDNGKLAQETDAMGIPTSYIYDGLGRVVSKRIGLDSDDNSILPAGSSEPVREYFSYYPTGRIKTHTDPKNLVTRFEYDGVGNKTKETGPLLNITRYEYDDNNNLISVLYPEGVIHSYEYDLLNRVTMKYEQGVETRMRYNANNQLTIESSGNNIDTVFIYDNLGRLVEKTQGWLTVEQTTSRFGYDSNSNMVYVTNGLDKTVFYQYDELNRRVLETKASDVDPTTLDPDNINYAAFTASKKVRYDAGSNPDKVTKADNSSIYYIYDNLDRVTQVKHNTRLEQEFFYDTASRMILSFDYNRNQHTQTVEYLDYNLYQQHTIELQNARQVETGYDDNANLTGILYPSGKTITRTYTDNNQLETVVNGNLTLAAINQYNGLGSIRQMTLGNGIDLSFDYDTHNRETQRIYTKGSTLYNHEITFRDDQGNIREETIASVTGTVQKTHTYDNLDRLTGSTVTNGPSLSWTYDLEGNWTSTNQNGISETRTLDNDNQYDSITGQSPAYDANGNMTVYNGLTYVYDWANRLVQVKEGSTVKIEYFYDARNRRVKTLDASSGIAVAIEYIYHDSRVIEEYKDGSLDKTFVYANYIDDPIVMTSGGNRYYYIKDRQFSIKAVSDDTGSIVESYEYSAYGVMTIFDNQNIDISAAGSAIDNPYGYTGRRWDAYTGLWYYRNRMYSPMLGRFMQKDPAGYVDGLNLYAYVLNNPLMYTDPMGLMARYDSSYFDSSSSYSDIYQIPTFSTFEYDNNISLNVAKVPFNASTNIVNDGISIANNAIYDVNIATEYGTSALIGYKALDAIVSVKNFWDSIPKSPSDVWSSLKNSIDSLKYAKTYETSATIAGEVLLAERMLTNNYLGGVPKKTSLTYDISKWGEYGLPSDGNFVRTLTPKQYRDLKAGRQFDFAGSSQPDFGYPEGMGFVGSAEEVRHIKTISGYREALKLNYDPKYIMEFQLKDPSKLQNVLDAPWDEFVRGGKSGSGFSEWNYPGINSTDIINPTVRLLE